MYNVDITSKIKVEVKNFQSFLNLFAISKEFGKQNTIINAGIIKKKLNFKSPPSKENLNLSITKGAKPFSPNIDEIIWFALSKDDALK